MRTTMRYLGVLNLFLACVTSLLQLDERHGLLLRRMVSANVRYVQQRVLRSVRSHSLFLKKKLSILILLTNYKFLIF